MVRDMKLQSYKEFTVWQKAMDLAVEVYSLVKKLPKEELYGLSSQLRRAAISVLSNIAEGQGRNSAREFVKFLAIARGSQCEVETQLQLCIRLEYLSEEDTQAGLNLCEEVSKMLNSLIKKISSKMDGI